MATNAFSGSIEEQAGEAAAYLDFCDEDDLKRNLDMRYRNSDDYKKSKMLNTYIGSTGSQGRYENDDCNQWKKFAKRLLGRTTSVASPRSNTSVVPTNTNAYRLCRLALNATSGTWDYSTDVFRRKVEEAKSRDISEQDCARIIFNVRTTTVASSSSESIRTTAAGIKTVCYMALDQKMGTWSHADNSRSYVKTAKARGFSVKDCAGILDLKISGIRNHAGSGVNEYNNENLKIGHSLDDMALCQKSTIISNEGITRWGGQFNSYVGTAQTRGLSIENCRDILELYKPSGSSIDGGITQVGKTEKDNSGKITRQLDNLIRTLPKIESTLSTLQLCASSVVPGSKGIDWDSGNNKYLRHAKSLGLTLKRCKEVLRSLNKKTVRETKKLTGMLAYEAGKLSVFSDHCSFFGRSNQLYQAFKHQKSFRSNFNAGSEDNNQDNVAGGYDYEQNLDCSVVVKTTDDFLREVALIKITPAKPEPAIQSRETIVQLQKLKDEVISLELEREKELKAVRLALVDQQSKEDLVRRLREENEAKKQARFAEIKKQRKLEQVRLQKLRKKREEHALQAEIEQKRKEELARLLREKAEVKERARLAEIEKQRRIEQARIKLERERVREIARVEAAKRKLKLDTLKKENRDSIAVIIGNKNYKGDTPDVIFAKNDADAMKKFILSKLFYRPGNLIDLRDATQAQLREVFGTESSYKGQIYDYVREK